MLQFIRSELPALTGPEGAARHDDAEARWRDLRTDLRKAYNQVALFGADEARAAGLHAWRTARNGGNDFFGELRASPDISAGQADLSERARAVASDLGTAGDRFLEACRKDLQSS